MFFDYDGHATNANDNKIKELLTLFNEETEKGKLYISYPMVEALKHYSGENEFKLLKVSAKENIHYKKQVSDECSDKFRNLTILTKENWIELTEVHLMKMNLIVNDDFVMPTELIEQSDIFKGQLTKYIEIDSTVAVLSAFPIFIFDYYGYDKINLIISSDNGN